MRKKKDKERQWKKEQMVVKSAVPIPAEEAEPRPGQSAAGAGDSETAVDRAAEEAVQGQEGEKGEMAPQ